MLNKVCAWNQYKGTPRNRTAIRYSCSIAWLAFFLPESTQMRKRGQFAYLFYVLFSGCFLLYSFLSASSFSSCLLSPPFLLPIFPSLLSTPSSPPFLHFLTPNHAASCCCCASSGSGSFRWIKGRPKDPFCTQNCICPNGPHPRLLSLPQGCLCFFSLEREGSSVVREISLPQERSLLQEGMFRMPSSWHTPKQRDYQFVGSVKHFFGYHDRTSKFH